MINHQFRPKTDIFQIAGWGGKIYEIDPNLVANPIYTCPPIRICKKILALVQMKNPYTPLDEGLTQPIHNN